MSQFHNWNQFHKVLTILGFIQVSSYEDRYLYYRDPYGKKMAIPKSTEITIEYAQELVKRVGIDYVTFVKIYTGKMDVA